MFLRTQARRKPSVHSLVITRSVNKFFRGITPQTPQLQLTNRYEVRRKILSLKPRATPGEDGITSLMIRNLSRKALTYLTEPPTTAWLLP